MRGAVIEVRIGAVNRTVTGGSGFNPQVGPEPVQYHEWTGRKNPVSRGGPVSSAFISEFYETQPVTYSTAAREPQQRIPSRYQPLSGVISRYSFPAVGTPR